MAEMRRNLYKCRGCGQTLAYHNKDGTMLKIGGVEVRITFNGGETERRFIPCNGGIENGVYLLHHCADSRLCVCDFIGWEEIGHDKV